MTVILHHETSPRIALQIARTRCIRAGPILGDSGLNVIIPTHANGEYFDGQAQNRGAILIFHWNGPVSRAHFADGYPVDTLYDQHPHRGFVPVGTTNHLKLHGIQLNEGFNWEMAVELPEFRTKGSKITWAFSKCPRWKSSQASLIKKEVERILSGRPTMSVVFPEHCIYKNLLLQKYPNVDWENLGREKTEELKQSFDEF